MDAIKWQVRIEAEIPAGADFVEARADELMEYLVDEGIEDPTVGASLTTAIVEVEFVVEARSLPEAQLFARDIMLKAWGPPTEAMRFIGESTALVPA